VGWLSEALNRQFDPDARWLQNHIIHCQRCQQRFISYGKINLAISAIKSQPHKLDLLMCANSQTIGVLKHSLRNNEKAKQLKAKRPDASRLNSYRRYTSSVLNVAACVTILLLMKIGVFSSVNICQNQGQKVIEKYYANRIGDDLADEIFPKDTKITKLG
jgi:hypothetical protein